MKFNPHNQIDIILNNDHVYPNRIKAYVLHWLQYLYLIVYTLHCLHYTVVKFLLL